MIKPKGLKSGDCIGVISPASPVKLELFQRGIHCLQSQGFKVEIGKFSLENNGFLAGSKSQRLYDIHQMFRNPVIKGIICSRGGYGTLPLLEDIDFELIKKNPKVFVGYSDITALHIAIGQRADLMTFHGPMIAELSEERSFNIEMLKRMIMKVTPPLGEIFLPVEREKIKVLYSGKATGKLIGGNLSVICSTLGTDFEIDCRDKILIIEEIGEPNYRIHRMLTQLSLAGKLKQAAGFIIGEFVNCIQDEQYPLEYLLRDFFVPLKKAALWGLKCGHGQDKVTLPLGCTVTINHDKLIMIESAVV